MPSEVRQVAAISAPLYRPTENLLMLQGRT
ncbi:hypothetical protein M2324_003454 [Rhodovulum sulfidophilum]|nr:hypothetical protein [Rhodovulum sulfidophilum]